MLFNVLLNTFTVFFYDLWSCLKQSIPSCIFLFSNKIFSLPQFENCLFSVINPRFGKITFPFLYLRTGSAVSDRLLFRLHKSNVLVAQCRSFCQCLFISFELINICHKWKHWVGSTITVSKCTWWCSASLKPQDRIFDLYPNDGANKLHCKYKCICRDTRFVILNDQIKLYCGLLHCLVTFVHCWFFIFFSSTKHLYATGLTFMDSDLCITVTQHLSLSWCATSKNRIVLLIGTAQPTAHWAVNRWHKWFLILSKPIITKRPHGLSVLAVK